MIDFWPVLTAGPTPQIDTDAWEFVIRDETRCEHHWNWRELIALGVEDITVDIHGATHWSRLAMSWRGVRLDKLFEHVETEHDFVMAPSYGGYTANLCMEDLLDGRAWIATEANGEPLSPDHGGPARLLIPHLYFWKSAKWIGGLTTMAANRPGFWERNGNHLRGDPWREERYW